MPSNWNWQVINIHVSSMQLSITPQNTLYLPFAVFLCSYWNWWRIWVVWIWFTWKIHHNFVIWQKLEWMMPKDRPIHFQALMSLSTHSIRQKSIYDAFHGHKTRTTRFSRGTHRAFETSIEWKYSFEISYLFEIIMKKDFFGGGKKYRLKVR